MEDSEWKAVKAAASRIVEEACPRFDLEKPEPRNVRLRNVFDLVFLCVSLLEKERMTAMLKDWNPDDFYALFEGWWDKWSVGVEEILGTNIVCQVSGGFCGGPGPMGGTRSAAERYFLSHPGFGQRKFLLDFFLTPEINKGQYCWQGYCQSLLKAGSFGIWQAKNQKTFCLMMEFARYVCGELEAAKRIQE